MIALDDGDVRILQGDAREQLATLPDESVQCIVTSPPFWALRDYGMAGQIGLEPTPEAWCDRLVDVFRECRRVLRGDGVLWLEVGDTYNAYNGNRAQSGGISRNADKARPDPKRGLVDPTLKTKDLVGAPWMLAFALRADGWYLRSDTIWARPNPMPESIADRPTKAHSYVFLLTKSARYFYDADAIREKLQPDSLARYGRGSRYDDEAQAAAVPYAATRPRGSKRRSVRPGVDTNGGGQGTGEMEWDLALGANARSVWSIPTEPTPFAHFATFPQALVERCLRAGTSEHGCCAQCGAPWARMHEEAEKGTSWTDHTSLVKRAALNGRTLLARSPSIGWTPTCTCGCGVVEPCTVLDPFMGSGTTALVARRLGRRALGVELNPEYIAIAAKRLQQLPLVEA